MTTLDDAVPDSPQSVQDTGKRRRHTIADLYHERTNFSFIDRSWRWAVLSGVLIVVSISALLVQGLNLGIEFEGGVAWQVPSPTEPQIDEVRGVLDDAGVGDAKVSILDPATSGDDYQIRVQSDLLDDPVGDVRDVVADAAAVAPAEVRLDLAEDGSGSWTATATVAVDEDSTRTAVVAIEGMEDAEVTVIGDSLVVSVAEVPPSRATAVATTLAAFAGVDVNDVSVDTVGPTWGERVTRKAIQALVTFFVVVALYLSFRFEWKMALAAIVAVAHDIVLVAGFYAVFQFRVTPATVTAFLTILGFSLYDTVVVFDKVRENTEHLFDRPGHTYSEMVNKSLNQVLMRSLSTSVVAVLPVASLLVVGAVWLGATSLADFSLALLAGLIVGTYSSLFVATPILAAWKEREPKLAALRERAADPAVQAAGRRREEKEQRSTQQGTKQPVAVSARGRQQRRKKRR